MFPLRYTPHRKSSVAVAALGAVALAALTTACSTSSSQSSAVAAVAPATLSASALASSPPSPSASATASATASPSASSSRAASAPASTPAAASAPATSAAATAPAAPAELTGAPATALIATATTNSEAAASMRMVGSTSGSQSISFDLTLVKNVGCEGTMTESAGEFKLVDTAGYIWVLPNAAFYQSEKISSATIALIGNRYLKMKSTDTSLGDFNQLCVFSTLFGQLTTVKGPGYTAVPVTYGGTAAYKLTSADGTATVYVSRGAAPLLLNLTSLGNGGGTFTFSGYGAVTSVTEPTAAESIDASQIGL